jgi:hypothetical protein
MSGGGALRLKFGFWFSLRGLFGGIRSAPSRRGRCRSVFCFCGGIRVAPSRRERCRAAFLLLRWHSFGAFAARALPFGFLLLRWHPRDAFAARALPLCGAAVTFFAAAKKVTKESRF